MEKRHRHPVERCMAVLKTITPPDVGVVRSKKKPAPQRMPPLPRLIKPQDPESGVLTRLLGCNQYIRDPLTRLLQRADSYTAGNRMSDGREDDPPQRGSDVVDNEDAIHLPQCTMCSVSPTSRPVSNGLITTIHNHSPEPPLLSNKLPVYNRIERLVWQNAAANSVQQFPLSAVCVRWRANRTLSAYDIYELVGEFGPIETVQMTSTRSAVVVFTNLSDSCDAVNCKVIGQHKTRLFCDWLHKSMASKLFLSNGIRLKAVNHELLNPTK